MGVQTHNPLILFRRVQQWPQWASLCFVVACGPAHSDHPPQPSPNRVPDYLSTLPDLQTIEPDSLAIQALRRTTDPGPILLTLESGDQVAIDYTLLSFAGSKKAVLPYKEPLLLQPPVTVSARGQRHGAVGETFSFSFAGSPEFGGVAFPTLVSRLPEVSRTKATTWPIAKPDGPFLTASTELAKFKLDGEPEADDQEGRRYLPDALYDVPATLAHIDMAWVNIAEMKNGVRVAMQFVDAPKLGEFTSYGFEIGTSGINTEKFGSGASYEYKVEVRKAGLTIEDRNSDEEPRLVDDAKVAVGSLVEVFVPFTEMPKLAGKTHLAVRPFAIDWGVGITVLDRMEPAFLRSPFAVLRSQTQLPGERVLAVDLHLEPSLTDSTLVSDYFRMIPSVANDLEKVSGIPFYRSGAFPLFYVPTEERGYAGLNTTDRGTLTTLGPGTSLVAKTQLMAHEIAHLLNARSSQLDERWLQEAHSEWIAERILYRHFPTRTVYKFLRDLRYDRYFDLVADGDDFPLDSWAGESSSYGYEKSFLFLNLLEQQVGTKVLTAIFQSAVNVPFDSKFFQEELERLSGTDLDELFSGWVFPGDIQEAFLPEKWFLDGDDDGLLDIDEKIFGTGPTLGDTDSDGFSDGEEYFAGRDPLLAEQPLTDATSVRIVGTSAARTNDFLRLQTGTEHQVEYTLAAGSDGWQTTGLPAFVFPPWRVQARVKDVVTSASILNRPLYVDAEEVATPLPSEVFYPTDVLTTIVTDVDLDTEIDASLLDSQADLPSGFGGFNIAGWSAEWKDDAVQIDISFAETFDANDFRGDITLVWDRIDWKESGPDTSREYTLIYANGTPYWSTDASGAPLIMASGFATKNKGVTVTLTRDQISAWESGAGDKNICLWTTVHLDGSRTIDDHAGCLILDFDGFNRYQARADDHWNAISEAQHVVDLYLDADDDLGNRASLIRDTAATAIRRFESQLARPLFERLHWPIHAFILPNGSSTIGSARQLAGAYLAGRSNLFDEIYLFLIMEELSRLHATDLLARHEDPPYWIQEIYIQWLTGGAAYRILPTADVKNFHHARIDQYTCYINQLAGCEDTFTGDLPLSEWTDETNSATGSPKSLMFLLVLNATVGTEQLAQIFSDFTNHLPTEQELLAALQNISPAQASTLATLWTHWVDGSGSLVDDQAAILDHFVDDDLDGLFLVEEQIRGSSDASADAYP